MYNGACLQNWRNLDIYLRNKLVSTETDDGDMDRAVALGFMQNHYAEMVERFDVKRLAIFGSTARDEAGPNSDLDVLVEFNKLSKRFDPYYDLEKFLENQLAIKVDVVPMESVRKELKENIFADAIYFPINNMQEIQARKPNMARKRIRKWNLFYNDMIQACLDVINYSEGLDFEQFIDDRKTLDAISHKIEVIGEAAKSIPPEIMAELPEIPWVDLVATRNRIIHEYFEQKEVFLWGIVQTHAPELLARLENFKQRRSDLFQ